jgi:hypothetical protein
LLDIVPQHRMKPIARRKVDRYRQFIQGNRVKEFVTKD